MLKLTNNPMKQWNMTLTLIKRKRKKTGVVLAENKKDRSGILEQKRPVWYFGVKKRTGVVFFSRKYLLI
jgi:hypothetical protein